MKEEFTARAVPPFASLSMLGLAILIAPVVPIAPLTFWLLGGVSAVTTGEYILSHWYRSPLDKYFEESNPSKKFSQIPYVKDRVKTGDDYTYYIKLPPGMSTDDIEKQQSAIEQYLGASISMRFDYDKKLLVLTTTKKRLKAFYKYALIQSNSPLGVCLGYDLDGPVFFDLAAAPHLLIAGATGAGKSVLLRSIITSLILTKPVDLHLVDFQRVELGIFKKCTKVQSFCSEPVEFSKLLAKLKKESDKRLTMFDQKGVVNIEAFNKGKHKLKYIVVVIDEFASLADREYKNILDSLKVRIAQDRKCGIHYIICTQRPSVDVVSGTIKANIPTRIALKTATDTDSRVILDEVGAASLRGAGHAILKTTSKREFQAMFLSETDAYSLVEPTFKEKRGDKRAHTTRPPRTALY